MDGAIADPTTAMTLMFVLALVFVVAFPLGKMVGLMRRVHWIVIMLISVLFFGTAIYNGILVYACMLGDGFAH